MRLPKSKYTNVHYEGCYIGTVYTAEQMKAFAHKAVLMERAECAKACEEKALRWIHNTSMLTAAKQCAHAIRARGTQ